MNSFVWLVARNTLYFTVEMHRKCWLHCALSLAAQCIVIGPVCLQRAGGRTGAGVVCLWLCGSVATITRNCMHRSHQTGSVGEGSDHLQLIKFWPSCTPGKGVYGGAKILGSALLQLARSVCVTPSAFFITLCVQFSSALYCYRSCLCVCNGRAACVCVWVCVFVGLLPR